MSSKPRFFLNEKMHEDVVLSINERSSSDADLITMFKDDLE